jgi:putative PIN family toxin of toxin-antitoxin system
MIRAVLDTNIVVSALLNPDGLERRLLRLGLVGTCTLVVSPDVFAEYERVLQRPRFRLQPEEVSAALRAIRTAAEWVRPKLTLTVSPDESDNRFLECAQSGEADYLVTGNPKHFPAKLGQTRVVRTRALLVTLQP